LSHFSRVECRIEGQKGRAVSSSLVRFIASPGEADRTLVVSWVEGQNRVPDASLLRAC